MTDISSLVSKITSLFSFPVLFALLPSTATAQIIPDSSLGAESSVVESNNNRDTIKGGAIRDANLFHSFQEFNVEALREAYFTNPDGIANIFSRVTGNNISDLQGVLGVLGNANLYLINPNGILFAPGGEITLGGLIETGTIGIAEDNTLSFPEDVVRGDISVTDSAIISVLSREGGGLISVKGKNVNLTNGSRFIGGIRNQQGSINAQAGDIIVNATESIVIDGQGNSESSTGIFSQIGFNALGNAGNIELNSGSVTLHNGGILSTRNLGIGNAGNISINAANSIRIDGQGNSDTDTGIFSQIGSNAVGNAGHIELNARSVTFNNGTRLSASNFGQGKGGNVTINTTDNVSFTNDADIFVVGNGGGFD